jgi:hypothetical protein
MSNVPKKSFLHYRYRLISVLTVRTTVPVSSRVGMNFHCYDKGKKFFRIIDQLILSVFIVYSQNIVQNIMVSVMRGNVLIVLFVAYVFIVHASVSKQCPNGWVKFEDNCYIFSYLPLENRETCRNHCESGFGNVLFEVGMLCIENSAQNDFVASNIADGSGMFIAAQINNERVGSRPGSLCSSSYTNFAKDSSLDKYKQHDGAWIYMDQEGFWHVTESTKSCGCQARAEQIMDQPSNIAPSTLNSGRISVLTSPTVTDCTTSCSFLTGGQTSAVSNGNIIGYVSITTDFKIQFDVSIAGTGSYPQERNFFELRDIDTGTTLVSLNILWANGLRIYHYGVKTSDWTLTLSNPLSSTYTTVGTGCVAGGCMSTTSTDAEVFSGTSSGMSQVDTSGKVYAVYASEPYDGSNPSAGGNIKNIYIIGNTTYNESFSYTLRLFHLADTIPSLCNLLRSWEHIRPLPQSFPLPHQAAHPGPLQIALLSPHRPALYCRAHHQSDCCAEHCSAVDRANGGTQCAALSGP